MTNCSCASWDNSDGCKKVIKVHVMIPVTQHCHFRRVTLYVHCNIHVVFIGIAFEQGHILPTPETVPFRLTRDVEDGMGVFGIEGVFRR